MSAYQFSPSPAYGIVSEPFVTWTNGFTDQELSDIEKYCDKDLELKKATIAGKTDEDEFSAIRNSKVAWISYNQETVWFYDRMAYIARCLNGQFYKFDLWGFSEDFQYTVYDGTEKDHYTWHVDMISESANTTPPRKLSMVLQLSDPESYNGGNLQIMTSSSFTDVRKERGLVTAFPSYILHRVTPVTKGIRKTIVIWTTGPQFR